MTLDEVLAGLFPSGHSLSISAEGWVTGTAKRTAGGDIAVIGIVHGQTLGTQGVMQLADLVLRVIAAGGDTPILVLVDTAGQTMSRREEMLGLYEYLAHLAKCLFLASMNGHRTIGLVYGKAAAGAFLATGLATDRLYALPGADTFVMDLPSMARVTKMPLQQLTALAATTPVFAPGLEPMVQAGAICGIWNDAEPLHLQMESALAESSPEDARDARGQARGGRKMAAGIAARVGEEAIATVTA